MTKVAAIDIGATSGRVVVASLGADGPVLDEVARFPNGPRRGADGSWTWPIEELAAHVADGTAAAVDAGARAWGIDTWAVDYGVLLPADGPGLRRLARPEVRAYRDPRHESGLAVVERAIAWPELYGITGIQRMAINTVNQVAADRPQRIAEGTTFLLVPDLLAYWATGALATDVTNASSTGMVDPRTRQWSDRIIEALGVPRSAFLATDEPGAVRGEARDPRLGGLPLIGVATHDTASAFAGAPIADRDRALVLSLGTWALIGAEVVGAVPGEEAMALNVTHELGVDGTVRLLRNVCGMWLLEECRRAWAQEDGREPDVPALLEAAATTVPFAAVFDVDAPELAPPGQAPATIAPHLRGSHDGSRGAVVRAILESLVIRLARRAREIEGYLGAPRDVIHVVGGASRMSMVMQWLADATGKRVIAGPVEATALGNALVQWRTLGVIGDLAEGRALVAAMPGIRTYEPAGSRAAWDAAAARLEDAP